MRRPAPGGPTAAGTAAGRAARRPAAVRTACVLLVAAGCGWMPLRAAPREAGAGPDAAATDAAAAETGDARTGGRDAAAPGAPASEAAAPTAPAPEAPAPPRETIVVTAEGDGASADPSAFATIIRAADLDEPLLTLPDLLRRTVGVQVRSLGGQFATVSIRGSSAEQVVVYLDGVPLNHALGGAVNLADVPLAGLDTIAIYRGAAPAFLSSASIGGAILLRSRRPGEGPAASAHASYGSYGSAEAGGTWSFTRGRADGLLAVDGATSDGDFRFLDNNGTPFDAADDAEADRVNNGFRRGHLLARVGRDAGRARLSAGLDLFGRDAGVPGLDAWPSTDARLRTGRMLVHGGAEIPGLASGRLLLRGLVSHMTQDQEYEGTQGDLGLLTRSTDNRMRSTGAEASGTFVLSARQGLSFLGALRLESADLRDRLLDPSDRGAADRRVTTLTVEDAIESPMGRVTLAPSLRHERWISRFEPGPAPGVLPPRMEAADRATTGRLGLRVRLGAGVDLRANAGSFLRLPDLTELYGDQGTIVGNPGLRPESGVNADLGVAVAVPRPHGAIRDLRVEAVVFETRADDLILYVPNAQSTVVARNIGAARIRGVEASLGFSAGRRFSGSLNAVRQWAVDDSDRYTRGRRLPGRPRDELSASAGLLAGGGRIAWEFTYVGPNYVDAINSASSLLPSRYLHDVSYRRPLSRHLEASFEVRNVFDDRTVDVARFPLPGRSFGARLQWTY